MLYVSFCPYSSVSIRPRHLASLFNKTSHSVKFMFGTMDSIFFFFCFRNVTSGQGDKIPCNRIPPANSWFMPKSALPLSDKEIHASSFIFYQCYSIIGQSRVFPSDAGIHLCRAGSDSLLC